MNVLSIYFQKQKAKRKQAKGKYSPEKSNCEQGPKSKQTQSNLSQGLEKPENTKKELEGPYLDLLQAMQQEEEEAR